MAWRKARLVRNHNGVARPNHGRRRELEHHRELRDEHIVATLVQVLEIVAPNADKLRRIDGSQDLQIVNVRDPSAYVNVAKNVPADGINRAVLINRTISRTRIRLVADYLHHCSPWQASVSFGRAYARSRDRVPHGLAPRCEAYPTGASYRFRLVREALISMQS